jgi:hypothetical protein
MTKIIVDQIQKGSGGDALTVPTAAATKANQPIVGSTAGVLSHSPVSMPAADGTAGQVVKTDGSGTLGFTTIEGGTVPDDNILSIGMVVSSSARRNLYSTGDWASTGPSTTYYNRLSDAASIYMAWNMLLGDGRPDETTAMDSNDDRMFYSGDDGEQLHREMIFAHNRRLGHNYGGITISCIPIRNHASSGSTNVSLKVSRSGGSNYGGTGIVYYTPTYSSGTNYANATGGAWTTLEASTSSTDYVNYTATIPVAAGTTVLVMMTSNHRYMTTYRFKDTHVYYDLHTAFASDIKCDQRMLNSLWQGRQPAAAYNAGTPYELYTTCASLFGDR